MSLRTAGVHHVTAIAGDPQRNLDFYEGVLGLRLVKKTDNFDDSGSKTAATPSRRGTATNRIPLRSWISS